MCGLHGRRRIDDGERTKVDLDEINANVCFANNRAPIMKWALVLAGISDFARPAEKLSVTQNVALTATGLIWTRWCLIIKPKNYLYVFPSPLS